MKQKRTLFREPVLALRAVAVCISAALVVTALSVELSWTGFAIVFSQYLAILAFISPIARKTMPQMVGFAAISILAATLAFNATRVGNYPAERYRILPEKREADFISRAFFEEDGILLAARMLPFLGGISFSEARGFIPALVDHYQRMRTNSGELPTPLPATVLGRQRPNRFDLISFLPSASEQTESGNKRAVIFLHGSGGNWSLLCWLVAEPINMLGVAVFCPSTGVQGIWGSENGELTLRTTLDELKRQGYSSFILAGLSAGAVGAAELVGGLQEEFMALVLLFGSHPDAIDVKLPTLLIYGMSDQRFPAKFLEGAANRQKENSSEVELIPIDGDHFALVKQAALVQEAISSWLLRILSIPANSLAMTTPG